MVPYDALVSAPNVGCDVDNNTVIVSSILFFQLRDTQTPRILLSAHCANLYHP